MWLPHGNVHERLHVEAHAAQAAAQEMGGSPAGAVGWTEREHAAGEEWSS